MKKKSKLFILLFAIMTLVLSFNMSTSASGGYERHLKTGTNYHYLMDGSTDSFAIAFCWGGATVSCKSSNTKVATTKVTGTDQISAVGYVKKPGTTIITTTIKNNGKTYTYKSKLIIDKWVNPLQTAKIGNKSFVSKFKKNNACVCGEISGKLNLKAAKNWKITAIKLHDSRTEKIKTIKNNTKVNFKGFFVTVEVRLKNIKNNNVETVYMSACQLGRD